MAVDAWDDAEETVVCRLEEAARKEAQATRPEDSNDEEEEEEEQHPSVQAADDDFETTKRVSFGSPIRRWIVSDNIEAQLGPTNPSFKSFTKKLRAYFGRFFPEENIDGAIKVSSSTPLCRGTYFSLIAYHLPCRSSASSLFKLSTSLSKLFERLGTFCAAMPIFTLARVMILLC
jgi:hypothetical protein